MKTASADYQNVVVERLLSSGFKRLSMCNCIYIWYIEGETVLIYDYVDDFIFGGTSNEITLQKLTDPELNGPRILGMEIRRDRDRRIVMLTMMERILDLGKQYLETIVKSQDI